MSMNISNDMRRSNNKFALLSVVVLFLAFFGSIFWYFIAVNPYTTFQIFTNDPVSGLLINAPVEFHGVEAGTVKKIELLNPHSVRVLLQVNKASPITKSTEATIISRGLSNRGFTGYVLISLEDTKADSGPLVAEPGSDFPTIPTKPARVMTVDTAMNRLNNNAQQVADILASALDKQTIANLHELIKSLEQVSKILAKNNKKLNALIVNTEKASYQFKPLLDSSNSAIKLLDNQVLPKAYESLSNVDNLMDTLSNLADQIKEHPSTLIRGVAPPPPGPGE